MKYDDIPEIEGFKKIPLGRINPEWCGIKIGKWTTHYRTVNKGKATMLLCQCECGTIRPVRLDLLKNKLSLSCGCAHLQDITNQKFGRLTAIRRTGKKGHGGLEWECVCDCGKTCYVGTNDLTGGHIQSCGCLARERSSEANTKDIVGQKFDRLLVIKKLDKKDVSGCYYYECLCDCGNTYITNGKALRGGITHSCGCYNREKSAERGHEKALNLIGERFGRLVVIEKTEQRYRHEVIWKCRCDCGNVCYVYSNALTSGKVQSCGCLKSLGETKIKQLLTANNMTFKEQKTFINCVNPQTKKRLLYDFYINDNYLIEYDGIQHYKATVGWNDEANFAKNQERDKIKTQYCKDNNIPLIRIPYTAYDTLCIDDLRLETTKYRVV